jgi:hypothetical protein
MLLGIHIKHLGFMVGGSGLTVLWKLDVLQNANPTSIFQEYAITNMQTHAFNKQHQRLTIISITKFPPMTRPTN